MMVNWFKAAKTGTSSRIYSQPQQGGDPLHGECLSVTRRSYACLRTSQIHRAGEGSWPFPEIARAAPPEHAGLGFARQGIALHFHGCYSSASRVWIGSAAEAASGSL